MLYQASQEGDVLAGSQVPVNYCHTDSAVVLSLAEIPQSQIWQLNHGKKSVQG